MLNRQITPQHAKNSKQDLDKAAIRELHLLRAHEKEGQAGSILLVDSTVLHADTVMDPGERCLSLYQSILENTDAHLLLMPPAPPSGEQDTLTAAQLLKVPSFFHSFLIAALRASARGRVTLLLPCVQNADEIRAVRRLLSDAMEELYGQDEPFDDLLTLGICLGTAKAMTASRELLEEADLLVVDINALSHTVVGLMPMLRLVETAIGNAHVLRRFAFIDGALATDSRVLPHLVAMGADAVVIPFSRSVEISDKIHTKNSCK